MASSDSRSANTRRDQVYLFHYYFSQNLMDFGQFFSSFCAVILFAYLGLQFGPWASW